MLRALALLPLLAASSPAQVWAPAGAEFFESMALSRADILAAAQASRPRGLMSPAAARAAIKARALELGVPAAFADAALSDPRLRHLDEILEKFGPASPGRPAPAETELERYRRIFLTPERAAAGAQFLSANAAVLAEVQRRWGVDPALLAALCGVETYYGRLAGTFPVLSVFYTVARSLPARAAWYAKEGGEFLRVAYEQRMEPHAVLGSYAGAFGLVQFMPSSYNNFAVDFDGDGLRRLDQWPDALASAAAYLHRHGYRADDPFTPDSSIGRSLWHYNHRDAYVRTILELRTMILASNTVAAR